MLIGWLLAPAHLAGLFVAQFLSGLSMTAFEGGMDARLANEARPGTVTTVLAWSASTRALGSAIAVRTLPALVAAPAIGTVAGASAALLATTSLAAMIYYRTRATARLGLVTTRIGPVTAGVPGIGAVTDHAP